MQPCLARTRSHDASRAGNRFDEGLFFCLYDTPDRLNLCLAYREPDHPANRGGVPDPRYVRVIEDQYRRGDEVVGKAVYFADPETLFIVLSDHGFGSFQRGVNLNTLLFDAGMLSLKDGKTPAHDCRDLLLDVDWPRTSAYALGLGGIYLNLEGREGQGTVKPEKAEELKANIARRLTGLADPVRGTIAIRGVRPRQSVYSGPCVDQAPDLLVDFERGYRASWATSLGGVSAGHFEDNIKKWSGDHIIDPELVPGVLLMNRPYRQSGAGLADLAPTILRVARTPRSRHGRTLSAHLTPCPAGLVSTTEEQLTSESNWSPAPAQVQAQAQEPKDLRRTAAVIRFSFWLGLIVSLAELGLRFAQKPLTDASPGLYRMNRHLFWMIPTVNLVVFGLCGIVAGCSCGLPRTIDFATQRRLLFFLQAS